MNADRNLAAEYADDMVESIAGIMSRYDGTAHDDECEAWESLPRTDLASYLEGSFAGYDTRETKDGIEVRSVMLGCSCQERASDELLESYALELVAERGEPFSVLLTYGGPTAWVEWSGRQGTNSAELRVTWGSGPEVRRSAAIRSLASFYSEVMGDE